MLACWCGVRAVLASGEQRQGSPQFTEDHSFIVGLSGLRIGHVLTAATLENPSAPTCIIIGREPFTPFPQHHENTILISLHLRT